MRVAIEVRCIACPLAFCCANCRRAHERTVHNLKYECPICRHEKFLCSVDNLQNEHLLRHLADEHLPLHCGKCEKTFNNMDDLDGIGKCVTITEESENESTTNIINEEKEIEDRFNSLYDKISSEIEGQESDDNFEAIISINRTNKTATITPVLQKKLMSESSCSSEEDTSDNCKSKSVHTPYPKIKSAKTPRFKRAATPHIKKFLMRQLAQEADDEDSNGKIESETGERIEEPAKEDTEISGVQALEETDNTRTPSRVLENESSPQQQLHTPTSHTLKVEGCAALASAVTTSTPTHPATAWALFPEPGADSPLSEIEGTAEGASTSTSRQCSLTKYNVMFGSPLAPQQQLHTPTSHTLKVEGCAALASAVTTSTPTHPATAWALFPEPGADSPLSEIEGTAEGASTSTSRQCSLTKYNVMFGSPLAPQQQLHTPTSHTLKVEGCAALASAVTTSTPTHPATAWALFPEPGADSPLSEIEGTAEGASTSTSRQCSLTKYNVMFGSPLAPQQQLHTPTSHTLKVEGCAALASAVTTSTPTHPATAWALFPEPGADSPLSEIEGTAEGASTSTSRQCSLTKYNVMFGSPLAPQQQLHTPTSHTLKVEGCAALASAVTTSTPTHPATAWALFPEPGADSPLSEIEGTAEGASTSTSRQCSLTKYNVMFGSPLAPQQQLHTPTSHTLKVEGCAALASAVTTSTPTHPATAWALFPEPGGDSPLSEIEGTAEGASTSTSRQCSLTKYHVMFGSPLAPQQQLHTPTSHTLKVEGCAALASAVTTSTPTHPATAWALFPEPGADSPLSEIEGTAEGASTSTSRQCSLTKYNVMFGSPLAPQQQLHTPTSHTLKVEGCAALASAVTTSTPTHPATAWALFPEPGADSPLSEIEGTAEGASTSTSRQCSLTKYNVMFGSPLAPQQQLHTPTSHTLKVEGCVALASAVTTSTPTHPATAWALFPEPGADSPLSEIEGTAEGASTSTSRQCSLTKYNVMFGSPLAPQQQLHTPTSHTLKVEGCAALASAVTTSTPTHPATAWALFPEPGADSPLSEIEGTAEGASTSTSRQCSLTKYNVMFGSPLAPQQQLHTPTSHTLKVEGCAALASAVTTSTPTHPATAWALFPEPGADSPLSEIEGTAEGASTSTSRQCSLTKYNVMFGSPLAPQQQLHTPTSHTLKVEGCAALASAVTTSTPTHPATAWALFPEPGADSPLSEIEGTAEGASTSTSHQCSLTKYNVMFGSPLAPQQQLHTPTSHTLKVEGCAALASAVTTSTPTHPATAWALFPEPGADSPLSEIEGTAEGASTSTSHQCSLTKYNVMFGSPLAPQQQLHTPTSHTLKVEGCAALASAVTTSTPTHPATAWALFPEPGADSPLSEIEGTAEGASTSRQCSLSESSKGDTNGDKSRSALPKKLKSIIVTGAKARVEGQDSSEKQVTFADSACSEDCSSASRIKKVKFAEDTKFDDAKPKRVFRRPKRLLTPGPQKMRKLSNPRFQALLNQFESQGMTMARTPVYRRECEQQATDLTPAISELVSNLPARAINFKEYSPTIENVDNNLVMDSPANELFKSCIESPAIQSNSNLNTAIAAFTANIAGSMQTCLTSALQTSDDATEIQFKFVITKKKVSVRRIVDDGKVVNENSSEFERHSSEKEGGDNIWTTITKAVKNVFRSKHVDKENLHFTPPLSFAGAQGSLERHTSASKRKCADVSDSESSPLNHKRYKYAGRIRGRRPLPRMLSRGAGAVCAPKMSHSAEQQNLISQICRNSEEEQLNQSY